MRSRVSENCWPTSPRVWSLFMPMPKRMRSMRSSRGVSEGKHARRGLAQFRLNGGINGLNRVRVLDEIAKVRVLLVPNRSLHGERLLGKLENFPHSLQRHTEFYR